MCSFLFGNIYDTHQMLDVPEVRESYAHAHLLEHMHDTHLRILIGHNEDYSAHALRVLLQRCEPREAQERLRWLRAQLEREVMTGALADYALACAAQLTVNT